VFKPFAKETVPKQESTIEILKRAVALFERTTALLFLIQCPFTNAIATKIRNIEYRPIVIPG